MTKPTDTIAMLARVLDCATIGCTSAVESGAIPFGMRQASLLVAAFLNCVALVACGGSTGNTAVRACSDVVATGSPQQGEISGTASGAGEVTDNCTGGRP